MFSIQEGFDDSSATRCANGVSAINKSNDSLEEQNNIKIDDMESNMTKNLSTSTGEKDISSNEKIQQQNDKASHESQDDDEARAFRSQFDEIKSVSRMHEYFKNNAYNRFQGPAGRVPSAPLQKRTNETLINAFHQRSHSHSTHSQQTNRHMLKHQRSISSIQGLSFNRNPAMKFYPTHGLPSTPSTPSTPFTSYGSYGYDNTDDILSPLRRPLYHFDDLSSNDDALMKFRDIENCGGRYGFNNSRYPDEWDDSSPGYPSTPLSNGPFTPIPLTPSSNISPSTPFFAQPHSLFDDDELFEKAKILEEERLLLQIQQRKLDNAIAAHNLRYFNSDSSLDETEIKYKSNSTTPPLVPTRAKTTSFPFVNKITVPPPPRFQSSQEPIGTPIRKSGYITPPSTTPTGSSNFSLSASAPTFSLFSNPPALSLSHNLTSQRTTSDNNVSLNGKLSPLNSYPLTPSDSPPRTNNNDGYFSFCSYTNSSGANNNIWANNNESNYYKPLTPSSYFRAPLYTTPVDEREEDSLFADKLNNRNDYENNFTGYSLYCR